MYEVLILSMRILYIRSQFPKLSETFVLDQITTLINRGHDVRIIAQSDPKERIYHKDIDNYKLRDRVIYVNKCNDSLGFELTSNLIRVIIDCEIIHAHFATWATEFADKISQIIDIPYIFTVHAYDLFKYMSPDKLKRFIHNSKQLITVSKFNLEYITKYIGPSANKKISIIHSGINIKKFSPTKFKRDEIGKTKILSVGRLVEKKGFQDTINAFANLCKIHNDIELRIIGEGPLQDSLYHAIKQHDLESKILLLGNKTHDEVVIEMNRADIFVLPSITASDGDREGLPVSILEAQAMELPVVSTYHTGIPEAVKDGVSGFLVPERDIGALTERLDYLIQNKSVRNKMGKEGRLFIERHYNLEKEITKLEYLMDDIIKYDKHNEKKQKNRIISCFKAFERQKKEMLEYLTSKKDKQILELQAHVSFNKIKKSLLFKIYKRIFKYLKSKNRNA